MEEGANSSLAPRMIPPLMPEISLLSLFLAWLQMFLIHCLSCHTAELTAGVLGWMKWMFTFAPSMGASQRGQILTQLCLHLDTSAPFKTKAGTLQTHDKVSYQCPCDVAVIQSWIGSQQRQRKHVWSDETQEPSDHLRSNESQPASPWDVQGFGEWLLATPGRGPVVSLKDNVLPISF